jgi:hypothetical protein
VANEKNPALTAGPEDELLGGTDSFDLWSAEPGDGDLMTKMLRRLLELEPLGGRNTVRQGGSVYFVALFRCDLAHSERLDGVWVPAAFSTMFRISYLL